MGFRDHLASGDGWLPPTARLVRDSGKVLFIEPHVLRTEAEAWAYAKGWFDRAYPPDQWPAITVGGRADLDPEIDADLITELDKRPEGSWVAFGIAYRFRPDPHLGPQLRDTDRPQL
jgi:hypothetical protein